MPLSENKSWKQSESVSNTVIIHKGGGGEGNEAVPAVSDWRQRGSGAQHLPWVGYRYNYPLVADNNELYGIMYG